jgi:hypothetical protein
MRFMSTLCAVVLMTPVAALATEVASAQSTSPEWPLDSGSRVRVQAPIFREKTQVGTVVSTQGDTLHFRACCGTTSTAVGLRDITRMDVFRGTHSRKAKGALMGSAIGAALAAGITAATWKKTTTIDFGRGGDAAFFGVFGGLVGGLVGLAVGAVETDTWVRVKLPNRN